MNYGQPMIVICFIILLIALYVFIVRWVLRINDIIFYLDKINEKLARMEQSKEPSQE